MNFSAVCRAILVARTLGFRVKDQRGKYKSNIVWLLARPRVDVASVTMPGDQSPLAQGASWDDSPSGDFPAESELNVEARAAQQQPPKLASALGAFPKTLLESQSLKGLLI